MEGNIYEDHALNLQGEKPGVCEGKGSLLNWAHEQREVYMKENVSQLFFDNGKAYHITLQEESLTSPNGPANK